MCGHPHPTQPTGCERFACAASTSFHHEQLRGVGNRYELTPFAEQLLPACLEALASVHRVFDSGAPFDPSASRRTYRFAISDYASALIGPHIAEMINAAAPWAGVEFTPILRTVVELAPSRCDPTTA